MKPFDAIANALRIASGKTERNPSDAAKEAGNYAKGKLAYKGLTIAIENPKGSERSGIGKDGKRWRVRLPAAYGYVLGTEGYDKDHVDVYLGPDHASDKVFVVDQVNAENGKYDEHKCMLSYPNKTAALADYEKAFSDGKAKDRIGAVTEMSMDAFKAWVKSKDTKKPLGDIRKGYATGGAVAMPLIKSGSKDAISKNISAERDAGKKPSQAVAIALDVARRAKRADGGSVLDRAWENRPWKGYAENPPSMLSQLAISLGLMNPSLGRATRNMSMARVQPGEAPSYMPGDSLGRSDITMSMAGKSPGARGPGINVGQSGTGYGPNAPDPAWINFRNPDVANINMRNPKNMKPSLRPVDDYASGGSVSPADEILRGYASGGDVDFSTEDILAEALRRSEPAPVGLPDYLRGQIQDLKRGEGAYAEDVRPRGTGVWNLMGDVAGLGAEMTGIPSVVRGGGNIRKGWNEGDPVLGAAGLGQVALGALPAAAATKGGQQALGALLEGPWRSGAAGAALGLPQAVVDMKEAHAQDLQAKVVQKLRAMTPEQLRTYQQTIGANPDGRIGTDTLSKAVAHEATLAAKDDTAKAAAMEKARREGDAAVRAAEIKAQSEADAAKETRQREEKTKLPIRELMPDVIPYLPVVAGGIAGLSGGAIKNAYAHKYNKTLDDLIPRWEAAVTSRDPAMARELGSRVDAVRKAGPGGTLPALGVGAAEGTLIGLLPEEIDLYRGVPGAWERMTNLENVGKRAGMAAAIGAGSAYLGSAKAGASARKNENVKDFSPETKVMSGIGADDITTANSLAAYEAAVQQARARSRLATTEAEKDIAIGDAAARSATERARLDAASALDDVLAGDLASAEARRRIGATRAIEDQSGAAARPNPSPIPEAASSPTSVPPSGASTDMSLPPGVKLNARGIPYDIHTGQLIKKRLYTPREDDAVRTSRAPKAKEDQKSIPEDKPGRKKAETAEEYHSDPDKLTRGQRHGGAVKSALDTARKYAAGGAVLAGPVIGETGGREDALPVDVEHGSFVIPSDIVSHLGTGNTLAGQRKLEEVFGKSKPRANGGAVGIMISDGEHVLTPDQVAKVGGGDIERGHAVLDRMILKLRDDHIKTLKSLPGPAKG